VPGGSLASFLQISVVTQQGLISTVEEKHTASVAAQSPETVGAPETVVAPDTVVAPEAVVAPETVVAVVAVAAVVVLAVVAVVVPLVQVSAIQTVPSSHIPTRSPQKPPSGILSIY